jgi:hypothetical protein
MDRARGVGWAGPFQKLTHVTNRGQRRNGRDFQGPRQVAGRARRFRRIHDREGGLTKCWWKTWKVAASPYCGSRPAGFAEYESRVGLGRSWIRAGTVKCFDPLHYQPDTQRKPYRTVLHGDEGKAVGSRVGRRLCCRGKPLSTARTWKEILCCSSLREKLCCGQMHVRPTLGVA